MIIGLLGRWAGLFSKIFRMPHIQQHMHARHVTRYMQCDVEDPSLFTATYNRTKSCNRSKNWTSPCQEPCGITKNEEKIRIDLRVN